MRSNVQASPLSSRHFEWQQQMIQEAQDGPDHFSAVLERNSATY